MKLPRKQTTTSSSVVSVSLLLIALWLVGAPCPPAALALSSPSPVVVPRGSASRPLQKKKVFVLGAGGSMGALTFGFLQRACSLYGTGMGDYRTICACADTAKRLNSFISKHFCLAYANESCMKLTNLESVEALQSRLEGWDAIVLGSDMVASRRTVTFGSYEKSPNDKCYEMYWKAPGNIVQTDDNESGIVVQYIDNVLKAAKLAGIQHVVFVDEASQGASSAESILVENSGIPHTIIQPAGDLITLADYTYQKGIQGDLVLLSSQSPLKKDQQQESAESSSNLVYDGMSYQEDVAALCVQCLLSLDWTRSRTISVSTAGPATATLQNKNKNKKRPDQQWCVNSHLLEQALAGIQ